MEVQKLGLGFAALAIAAFGGFLLYSSEHDGLQNTKRLKLSRIKELRHELEEAEERKIRARQSMETAAKAAQESKDSAVELREKIEDARLQIKEAESSLASLKTRTLVAEERKRAAVDKQRSRALGKIYPSLLLPSGLMLQNAQITGISSTHLAFLHRGGRSNVPWDMLPKEMVEQFDLGNTTNHQSLSLNENKNGKEIKLDDPFTTNQADREAIRAQMDELTIQINRKQHAIDAANNRSARNPETLQRLYDEKMKLEMQLTRLRRRL